MATDRPWAAALLGGLLALLLGWSDLDLTGTAGVDPSYHAALHVAAAEGLNFGTDVVYTYGPLGFLKFPEFWRGDTGTLALAYTVLTRLALLAFVFAVLRRPFGRVGAGIVALVVAPQLDDPVIPLAFGAAVWMLAGEGTERQRRLAAGGLGLLAGIEALGKLNTGATVLGLAVLAALFAAREERVRLLATTAAAGIAAGLVGWLVTAQSFAALPDYAINSAHIVSGFSAAMVTDDEGWHYRAAFATFAIGGLALWLTTGGLPRRARLGCLALWALLSWLIFKQGFVRHSEGHAAFLFATALAALAAVPWRRWRVLAVAAIAVPLVALAATDGLDAPGDVPAAWDDLVPLVSGAERDELVAATVGEVRTKYALDAATLGQLEGRTAHVVPHDTAVVAAHGLRWRPVPVFQNYQAYTPALDELNADALLGEDAPERLLLAADVPVDRRVAGFDPPAQIRAMLCRYVPVHAQGDRWIVLARAENRCGPERRIGSETAAWSQPVEVPKPSRPDAMTFVRIRGADVSGFERLRALVFKADERHVQFNETPEVRRLVPGTAEDGLLMYAPADADLPQPFALAPDPDKITLLREDTEPGDEVLTYDFYEVPVAQR